MNINKLINEELVKNGNVYLDEICYKLGLSLNEYKGISKYINIKSNVIIKEYFNDNDDITYYEEYFNKVMDNFKTLDFFEFVKSKVREKITVLCY